MNANYDELMTKQLSQTGESKKILLHCCCAPCSSACLERLKDSAEICVLFYNPNIESEEYERRKAELIRFINETGWAQFIDCDRDENLFYDAVKGLEDCKEGGMRCEKCFELRLKKTYEIAKEGNFDFFTTTLTVSPLKNASKINEIGERIGGEMWLYSDFKKKNGYLESIKLSKEHNLYRQDYCGCIFSRRDRLKG